MGGARASVYNKIKYKGEKEMRKFFAVLLAALMLAALCVHAFEENAAEIDDLNTDMYLVNNDPDVQYDE